MCLGTARNNCWFLDLALKQNIVLLLIPLRNSSGYAGSYPTCESLNVFSLPLAVLIGVLFRLHTMTFIMNRQSISRLIVILFVNM